MLYGTILKKSSIYSNIRSGDLEFYSYLQYYVGLVQTYALVSTFLTETADRLQLTCKSCLVRIAGSERELQSENTINYFKRLQEELVYSIVAFGLHVLNYCYLEHAAFIANNASLYSSCLVVFFSFSQNIICFKILFSIYFVQHSCVSLFRFRKPVLNIIY